MKNQFQLTFTGISHVVPPRGEFKLSLPRHEPYSEFNKLPAIACVFDETGRLTIHNCKKWAGDISVIYRLDWQTAEVSPPHGFPSGYPEYFCDADALNKFLDEHIPKDKRYVDVRTLEIITFDKNGFEKPVHAMHTLLEDQTRQQDEEERNHD